jgi:hypothetical protein
MKRPDSGLAPHLIIQFDVEIFALGVVNRGRAASGVAGEINKKNILRPGGAIECGAAPAAEYDHRIFNHGRDRAIA